MRFKPARDVAIKRSLSAIDRARAALGVSTALLLKVELGCGTRGADISTYTNYFNAPGIYIFILLA